MTGDRAEYEDKIERCRGCDNEIEGTVVMMHDRFPFHPDCYEEAIRS